MLWERGGGNFIPVIATGMKVILVRFSSQIKYIISVNFCLFIVGKVCNEINMQCCGCILEPELHTYYVLVMLTVKKLH